MSRVCEAKAQAPGGAQTDISKLQLFDFLIHACSRETPASTDKVRQNSPAYYLCYPVAYSAVCSYATMK